MPYTLTWNGVTYFRVFRESSTSSTLGLTQAITRRRLLGSPLGSRVLSNALDRYRSERRARERINGALSYFVPFQGHGEFVSAPSNPLARSQASTDTVLESRERLVC